MKLVEKLASASATVTNAAINHIFVIDCSGSMTYDLPKMRMQLKNKLPSLIKENDFVSLVWFSGRGEFGKLVEKVKVNDLSDLNRLNTAIDRWLKPMGCTAFVEPLQTVKDLCIDNSIYSLMFLTDGCDNQWGKSQILSATSALADALDSAVFVEYGYYCNHALLTEMADAVNGEVIFAENFDRYEPIFDGFCKKSVNGKKVEVEVGNALDGFVWSCTENGAISYKVSNGKVLVPQSVEKLYWLEDSADEPKSIDFNALYKGLSLLAMNRKPSIVKAVLSQVGDVALFNAYANAYGKQNVYDFAEKLNKASEDASLRFTEGKATIVQPKDDAYTVVEVLADIKGETIDLSKMLYNRIGRKAEIVGELTDAEQASLAASIASARNTAEIKARTEEALKTADDRAKMKFRYASNRVRINGLTYNETRPNISVLCNISGTVELPTDAPKSLPRKFETSVFRNFTIVRDGLLNVEDLPIVASADTLRKWQSKDVPMTMDGDVAIVHLRKMPLINMRMVNGISAQRLADDVFKSFIAKANAKVAKAYLDAIVAPQKSANLIDKYGIECAEYLKTVGITDGGFAPKTTLSEPTDRYIGTEFTVKFKGFSTIPSYNAVAKKLASGKSLTSAEMLLKGEIDACEAHKSNADFVDWLKAEIVKANAEADRLMLQIASQKFAIVVGQTWFDDLSISNPTIKSNGIDATFELKDTEFAI